MLHKLNNYFCSYCNSYQTNSFNFFYFHWESHKNENTSMNKTYLADKKSSKSKRSASSSSSSSSEDDSSTFEKQNNTLTKNTGSKKIKRKDGTHFGETDSDILLADDYKCDTDLNKITDIEKKNQEKLNSKGRHKQGSLRVNYVKCLPVRPFPMDTNNDVRTSENVNIRGRLGRPEAITFLNNNENDYEELRELLQSTTF